MQLVLESLKNNFTALQYCIQYEVLQRKPVFESYRSFCKAVGPDVMDYTEFETRYLKFYNDQLEFDDKLGPDPEKLTLSELPVDIIDKIVRKLGPVDRINTSHVSKSLRQCVDRQKKPIDNAFIHLSEGRSYIKTFLPSEEDLTYEKTERGCSIKSSKLIDRNKWIRNKPYEIKTDSFWKTVTDDLIRLDPFRQLEVGFKDLPEPFWREYENATKEFHSKLHVTSLLGYTCCGLVSFLKLIKPGTLEEIELTRVNQSFDIISNMEQWKQAKKVVCEGPLSANRLITFRRFQRFSVRLQSITTDAITAFMNRILQSITLEKGEIKCIQAINLDEIRTVFNMNDLQRNVPFDLPIPRSNYLYRISIGAHALIIKRVKNGIV